MTPIPWRDAATLIRTSGARIQDGGRVIVAEGPLHSVLDIADRIAPAELRRHFIALPDRCAPPFRFEGEAITVLLGRFDRPGAFETLKVRNGMGPQR